MKKLALALLTVVVALGTGLYVQVWRPLFALPPALPRAEQALATPDMFVLAGINAKQAVFLERWFMDTPAAAPPDTPVPAIGERSLLDHLRAARIDPRQDLDYLLYALYPRKGVGLSQAIALIGRFDPGAVGRYLTEELHAKPIAGAGRTSYEVALTDTTSCKAGATWIVTADTGWILLADPASHAALLPRLAGAEPSGDGETRWWHDLARTDVAGVAIRRPPESGAEFPIRDLVTGAIGSQAGAFEHGYLGLGIEALPPAGRLRLVLDATDPAAAAEQIKAWRKAFDDSRARWEGVMPSVAKLYDDLSLGTEGARSTLAVTVNRATVARLQDVGNELISGLLSGFGTRFDAQPAAGGADQIDTQPSKFEPTASIGALPPYDPEVQFTGRVETTTGPFGVRLDTVQTSHDDDGLELLVGAYANGIPNIETVPPRARLYIDSVTSTQGEELLKAESCGRDRNGVPAYFGGPLPPRQTARKVVRLIPGADATALKRIAGHTALNLPTKTETVAVPDPKAGTVVEKNGARVTVGRISGGSLSYQVTGNGDRMLTLRALNAKGQPLASRMKLSGDLFLGGGLAVQGEYGGTIAALEIVFATEEQTAEFPFELTDFSLPGRRQQASGARRDDTPAFAPYTHQALQAQYSSDDPSPGTWKALPPAGQNTRLAETRTEAFEISLDRAQSSFGLDLGMTVRGPDAPGFARRYNLGEARLSRVVLKDGTALEPPTAPERSVWSTALRFFSIPERGALSARVNFFAITKAKPTDLQSLEGSLLVRFPTMLDVVRLDDLAVGRSTQSGGMTVRVTARSSGTLTVETSQDADRVVYIRLIDSQGQALGAGGGPVIVPMPGGGASFQLSFGGSPVRAEIIVAREMETATLPFTVALP